MYTAIWRNYVDNLSQATTTDMWYVYFILQFKKMYDVDLSLC